MEHQRNSFYTLTIIRVRFLGVPFAVAGVKLKIIQAGNLFQKMKGKIKNVLIKNVYFLKIISF